MKILEITNSGALSGGVFQMLELTKSLVKMGHDVTIACRPDSKIKKKAIKLNMKLIEFPLLRDIDIKSMYHLYKHLKSEQYDVVHAHHPKAHMIAMIATFFAKTPVFVVSRRVSFSIKEGKGILNPLKYTFGRIDMILSVANAIRELLIREGVKPDKVRTVYSGTDPERFNPETVTDSVRKELGLKADDIVITKVGHYSRWKGHGCFFDAARRVLEHNKDVKFILAGNGTHRDIVKEKLEELGIVDSFYRLGMRSDVPEILKASDIAVNAADRGEGLSGSLREALFMGLPVVASDIAGNREVCIPEKTGILFPMKDYAALADALITLVDSPDMRADMSRNGRELMADEFTVDAMVKKTLAIYEELLEKR